MKAITMKKRGAVSVLALASVMPRKLRRLKFDMLQINLRSKEILSGGHSKNQEHIGKSRRLGK